MSKIQKSILTFLAVIIVGGYLIGWIRYKQLEKDNRQLRLQNTAYDLQNLQLGTQLQQSKLKQVELVLYIHSLDSRSKSHLQTIDSLKLELKKVPSRYTNKTAAELARLMEERAK